MSLWCWNYLRSIGHFLWKHSTAICDKGVGFYGCDKVREWVEVHRLQRVPIPRLGNGLTLNVDMAGSLLYLSMVWNLDEWLSSWYSSECLLRVCITFWKGRKEGTAKMNQTEKKKKKAKGSRGQLGAGRRVAVGKKMRGCNDASHEKGLERDPDRSINCWLMLIHHPLPQSKRIWQLGVLQRSFFRWKFGENDWQRRHCYRLTPVSWWSCLIV